MQLSVPGWLHRRAVIIAPKTLLAHWEKELVTCGLGSLLFQYYGSSQGDRCDRHNFVSVCADVCWTVFAVPVTSSW